MTWRRDLRWIKDGEKVLELGALDIVEIERRDLRILIRVIVPIWR